MKRTMTGSPLTPSGDQLAILDWLHRAPFLRVGDLAFELGRREGATYDLVRRLREQRLVERVTRPSGQTETGRNQLYYVTPAGVQLLARQRPGCAADHAHLGEGSKDRHLLLLPRLDRLTFGYALVRNFLTHAPARLGELGHAARVQWTWIRDYQQSLPALDFPGYRNQARLFVDWLVVVHVAHETGQIEPYPLFIVLDHPCLSQQHIHQRLTTLLHARHVAALQHSEAEHCFPPVLILVPAGHRERHWQRLATDLAREEAFPLRGGVAVAPTISELSHAETNVWRLNWHTLYRYGPSSCRDLVTACPESVLDPAWCAPSHHWWQASALLAAESGPASEVSASEAHPQGVQHLAARLARLEQQLEQAESMQDSPEVLGLLGLALERRHYRLLELLAEFPLLNRVELAAFLGLHDKSVAEYLRELHPFQCLEREQFPAERHPRWRLSSRGLRLLALRHHLQIRKWLPTTTRNQRAGQVRSLQKGVEALRRSPTLTANIYTFLARLARDGAQRGHQLLWWETCYFREQSYFALSRRAWMMEKAHGIGEYQAEGQKVRFWLEWQGQETSTGRLVRTFAGYAAYIRSHAWVREGQVLPILLLVGEREPLLRNLARDALQMVHPIPLVFTTTVGLYEAAGPLAPIWRLALSPIPEGQESRRVFYDLRIRRAAEAG